MSEETVVTAKRGRGRPRKNPIERDEIRPKKTWKMRSNPNWETIDPSFEDSPDQLRIAPHLVPDGISLQWVTESVLGKPMPERLAAFERKGWTVVHNDDFDGQLDGLFDKKGAQAPIRKDGMVLVARPKELTAKARRRDHMAALEKVKIKEQALRGGDIGATLDAQHPNALGFNKINKSIERITVPED